jgi:carbon monoxide dehydrogenase subunit G
MRFSGERQVLAPVAQVWTALHDSEVLRATIPGCEELVPLDDDRYAATLRARVGPVTDTYRGSFSIQDPRPGSETRVHVDAGGRCGRLEVSLRVRLAQGCLSGTTALRYEADATVRGFVSRLGTAALTVAGGHFTTCFFRDLDRSLRGGAHVDRLAPLAR